MGVVLCACLFGQPSFAAGRPAPASVSAPSVADYSIVIANETKEGLFCRVRGDVSDWTGYEELAPDFALFAPSHAGGKSYLECKAPVSPIVYEMRAGGHYALIREKAGDAIALRARASSQKAAPQK